MPPKLIFHVAILVSVCATNACIYDWSLPPKKDAGLSGDVDGAILGEELEDAARGTEDTDASTDSAGADDDDAEIAEPPEDADSAVRAEGDDAGTAPDASQDAGELLDGEVEAGGPPVPISISGTGTTCASYTLASGDRCAGKFCGVTAAQVETALAQPRRGHCAYLTSADICADTLSRVMTRCGRVEKANNPLLSPAELRFPVSTCVANDPAIVPERYTLDCRGCYWEVVRCSMENCLIECLSGNTPECDSCNERMGCNDDLPTCANLPDPR